MNPLRDVMRRLLTGLLLCVAGLAAQAAQVQVAVAANMASPMEKIAAGFERATGHRVLMAVGSTGRFYAQIRNAAPYQVLLAADDRTPAQLERDGLAVAGTRFTYAIGRLALWSPRPDGVDAEGQVLRRGTIDRLAIADPRLAPYGAAAWQVLERLGVLPALRPRLVQGESIAQAYQFVASGNATLGLVALSQVQRGGRFTSGSGWVVPQGLHDPIRQDAIVLHAGRNDAATQAFMGFLRGEEARSILRDYGYGF